MGERLESGGTPRRRGRRVLIGGAVSVLIGAVLVTGLGALPATAAADTKLAFTSGPVTVPVGATQTIAVSVETATGTVDTSDNSTVVHLAIGTNPASGALSCTSTLSVTAVSGVATFTGCSISVAGNGYTLTAAATSLTNAVSGTFNISGPATKLAFTSGPVNAPPGATQTIAVSVEDANGNVVTTDNSTVVTLAIGTNPGSGVLTCTSTLSVTAVNGVATFTGCAISAAGTGYTLSATAAPLSAAVSGPFTVTGAATKLVFTSGPVSVPTVASRAHALRSAIPSTCSITTHERTSSRPCPFSRVVCWRSRPLEPSAASSPRPFRRPSSRSMPRSA